MCVKSIIIYNLQLHPSEANKFELLSPSDKKYQVERSLSKYININKLYKSETGEYYIAKNPNYIIGRSDINASEVYIIDTIEKEIKKFAKKAGLIAYLKNNLNISLSYVNLNNKYLDNGILLKQRYLIKTKASGKFTGHK